MTGERSQQQISTRQVRLLLVLVGVAFLIAAIWYLQHQRQQKLDQPPQVSQITEIPAAPDDGDEEPESQPDIMPDPVLVETEPMRLASADGLPFPDLSTDELLQKADSALEFGQLVGGGSDSALQLYQAVLAREPENEQAVEGLHLVAVALSDQVWYAVEQRQLSKLITTLPALKAAHAGEAEFTELIERAERLLVADRIYDLAISDLSDGRLITPKGNNALAGLLRARELDPESERIRDGLIQVEQRLLEKAVVSARENNFERAEEWLSWATRARNGSARVDAAAEEIQSYRENLLARVASEAEQALDSMELEAAEAKLQELAELNGPEERIAELTTLLERQRIFAMFEPGQVFRDRTSDFNGPEMVVLPIGEFVMGADPNDPDHTKAEEPQRKVLVERGFAMMTTEVSVAQFSRFVESAGYQTDAEREGFSIAYNEKTGRMVRTKRTNWRNSYNGRDAEPAMPVIHISWNDAQAYVQWLSRTLGIQYRLPSEAEFEYAIRGGAETIYWWGDESPLEPTENLTGSKDKSPSRRTWNVAFKDYDDGHWGPAPVGSLKPNAFGLYDMAGNVSEWVEDCWHDSYVRAPADTQAWVNRGCKRRVVRGGFWGGKPFKNRSAYRTAYNTEQRGSLIGFRVVRDLVQENAVVVAEIDGQ